MKKIISIVFFVAVTNAFSQQISNGGLENWQSILAPDSFYASPWLGPDTFVVKTNDAHSGQFAAEIQNHDIIPMTYVSGTMIYASVLSTGVVGWPFSSRPNNLTFWYKYIRGINNDVAQVNIFLFNTSSIIGSGEIFISSNDTVYTFAQVPINYTSAANPDTIQIRFQNSIAGLIGPNTKFIVDDIALDYSSGLDEIQNSRINFSPNPFTIQATITFSKGVRNATFSFYNLIGEAAAEVSGINGESFKFNRGNLPSGVYVFEVRETGNKIYRGKAVVY